jgi:Fur family ferric uptake transcriptional regulator
MPVEAVLAQFRDFLHQHSLRATDVRESIVRAILSRDGHFDIDELVHDMRARGIETSRATVYRVLPLLKQAGIIQSTVKTGDRCRYEAAAGSQHHDHMVCTSCGKIVAFQFEAFEMLQREVASKHGFRLTGHSHELFGLCEDCQNKSPESAKGIFVILRCD